MSENSVDLEMSSLENTALFEVPICCDSAITATKEGSQ
jgi:hypothetical protein